MRRHRRRERGPVLGLGVAVRGSPSRGASAPSSPSMALARGAIVHRAASGASEGGSFEAPPLRRARRWRRPGASVRGGGAGRSPCRRRRCCRLDVPSGAALWVLLPRREVRSRLPLPLLLWSAGGPPGCLAVVGAVVGLAAERGANRLACSAGCRRSVACGFSRQADRDRTIVNLLRSRHRMSDTRPERREVDRGLGPCGLRTHAPDRCSEKTRCNEAKKPQF
jgi:hypothetical protein